MKPLITIMSVLFLSPMAAHSFGLYEKSGGYEASGGYERSGGYEKSGGYKRSRGYNLSQEGYEQSQEGYDSYQGGDTISDSKRPNTKDFAAQIKKAKSKETKWITDRHEKDIILKKLRRQIRRTGGARDPLFY